MTSGWIPKKQFVAEVAAAAGISFRGAEGRVYRKTRIPVPRFEERRKNKRVVEVRLIESGPSASGFVLVSRPEAATPPGRRLLQQSFARIMRRRSFKLHLIEQDFAARLRNDRG
jgi:hypothetical protein